MRPSRLGFTVTLWLMTLATFFLFASKIIPWIKFHYFSEPAVLHYGPEPDLSSFDEAQKYKKQMESKGSSVVLKLNSGKSMPSFAHVRGDKAHHRAQTQEGLPVFFYKNGLDTVSIISSLDELESPWPPFILFIPFLVVSALATKLFLREIND